MRIVVSGTHATGKSTLVSDVAAANPQFEVLPDPFELVDDLDPGSAASFHEQLLVAAERLVELPRGADVIAERGPVDFLAYLDALVTLRRATVSRQVGRHLRAVAAAAMAHVDVLAVLPLTGAADIWVPDDEDPRLRSAMDEHLLELCEDDDVVGGVGCIVELAGSPQDRLAALMTHLGAS